MSRFQRYVDAFAKLMVEKLEKNAHKGEWQDVSDERLFEMLNAELVELCHAVAYLSANEALREAADVANFALMIASNTLRRQGKDLIEDSVYTYHGQWTVVNEVKGLMYSNQYGDIFYEDNDNARKANLPILPIDAKIHSTATERESVGG